MEHSTKQVDVKGILNVKNIETDILAATNDVDWKKTAKIVVARCNTEATGKF